MVRNYWQIMWTLYHFISSHRQNAVTASPCYSNFNRIVTRDERGHGEIIAKDVRSACVESV
jgi:hypothetical protein